ncbi:ras-related protein Rab-21-like [Brevipalpus obovatus]|uniref:ras-related protein Rab-21-like n=1 Tax=Brevipalpus obovatus TaxID=246614 RepID=UPI003D9F9AC3
MSSSSSKSPSLQFKVVLLGEGCVGKTSLISRFVENKFNESHVSTLQASFLRKTLMIEGQSVNISIWDTAGQERFHALGPIYYRDSNGAVVVYDVTDPDSLNKTKKWVKELKNILGDSVCLSVVGNKIDLLPKQENQRNSPLHSPGSVGSRSGITTSGVSPINDIIREAQSYGNNITNSAHYCTSAKINYGIDDMFLDLTKRMIVMHEKIQSTKNSLQGGTNSNRILRIEDNPSSDENIRSNGKCSC